MRIFAVGVAGCICTVLLLSDVRAQEAVSLDDAQVVKPAETKPADPETSKPQEKKDNSDEEKKDDADDKKDAIDPTVRPLQYFKEEFVRSCCAGWAKDIQLSGYIDNTFTHNFNHPNSRVNSLRVFDRKNDAYLFNMLQLYALKEPTKESRWGFGARMATGWDADVISPYREDNTDKFDFEELYASYLFDVGENGLLVKAGRFATLHGPEVIEQKDNWNISRSFLFGYAIPFTHTGVRANYKINDVYDFTFGVNRGWDTARYDNNDALSYEARLGATCSEKLSMATAIMTGPEQEGNDRNQRRLLDFVATYKFTDKLTGMLNADIAQDQGGGSDGGAAKWHGLAGYLKYDCNDKLSYAYRAEVFQDKDGARTGTGQSLWENTITAQYKFRENLWGRLEFRHDSSTENTFERGNGFAGNQNTIAVSMLITF